MNKMLRNTVLTGLAYLFAQPLFAETARPRLDLDALVGRKWVDIDVHGVQAMEYNLSLYTPVAELPVAIGGGLRLIDISNSDMEALSHLHDVNTAWGYEVAVELKAWLPESAVKLPFVPYVKYSHDIFSAYEFKGGSDDLSYRSKAATSGYKVNIGTSWYYTRTVQLLAEYSIGTETLKNKATASSNKEFGLNASAKSSTKSSFDSKTLLVGATIAL